MDTRAVGTCVSPCLSSDKMLEWILCAAVTHLSVTSFRDLALLCPVPLFIQPFPRLLLPQKTGPSFPSTDPALTPTQLQMLMFQHLNPPDRCLLLPTTLGALSFSDSYLLPFVSAFSSLPQHPHHWLAYSKLCLPVFNKYFLIAKLSN